jgi:hypothetical protein
MRLDTSDKNSSITLPVVKLRDWHQRTSAANPAVYAANTSLHRIACFLTLVQAQFVKLTCCSCRILKTATQAQKEIERIPVEQARDKRGGNNHENKR